jgi:hypothetical protein
MVSVLAEDSGYTSLRKNGAMGQIDPSKKPAKALQMHDMVNVIVLPVLGSLCLLSLFGYYDATKVYSLLPSQQLILTPMHTSYCSGWQHICRMLLWR